MPDETVIEHLSYGCAEPNKAWLRRMERGFSWSTADSTQRRAVQGMWQAGCVRFWLHPGVSSACKLRPWSPVGRWAGR
jgi:hypothetical protein